MWYLIMLDHSIDAYWPLMYQIDFSTILKFGLKPVHKLNFVHLATKPGEWGWLDLIDVTVLLVG